ncbi:MAG: phosphonate ABC transporter ATP-binding protein [Spirochaetaceae bacterium]|jgi:phosphonate transport system ATP-binding protein|nr:phosphonate ABC transporter ATP-binding protein [Spirochaetaceae bacterium]
MEPVIEVRDLKKVYRGSEKPAVRDLNLTVRQGEMIGVIGPSGAGKSTLLRCINRLVDPTAGQVFIEGEEITGASAAGVRKLRRRLGMIFQHHNLVARLTVMQNVMHGRLGYMNTLDGVLGRYTEADKRRALAILEQTGLGDFLYHRAGELSGGQRQRVGIVRALMQQPSALLCDEPIASLDPASAQVVMELIRDVCRRNDIACIVNLHQLDAALKYADRIIGMFEGEIVYDGPPPELTEPVIERIYGKPMDQLMIGGERPEANP